jgi:hypothetical protein
VLCRLTASGVTMAEGGSGGAAGAVESAGAAAKAVKGGCRGLSSRSALGPCLPRTPQRPRDPSPSAMPGLLRELTGGWNRDFAPGPATRSRRYSGTCSWCWSCEWAQMDKGERSRRMLELGNHDRSNWGCEGADLRQLGTGLRVRVGSVQRDLCTRLRTGSPSATEPSSPTASSPQTIARLSTLQPSAVTQAVRGAGSPRRSPSQPRSTQPRAPARAVVQDVRG